MFNPNGASSGAAAAPEHNDVAMIHGQHGIVADMTAAVHLPKVL